MINKPKVREAAIDTICGNLIMAGLLLYEETAKYFVTLTRNTDEELALILIESRASLDKFYENNTRARRN